MSWLRKSSLCSRISRRQSSCGKSVASRHRRRQRFAHSWSRSQIFARYKYGTDDPSAVPAFTRQPIRCEEASSSSGADGGQQGSGAATKAVTRAASTIKQAARPVMTSAASEMAKWERTFNSNAVTDPQTGEKYASILYPRRSDCLLCYRYLDQEAFVDAIAPYGDFEKITRGQFGVLFKVADTRKNGRVTWDEFVVFETILKKPVSHVDRLYCHCLRSRNSC